MDRFTLFNLEGARHMGPLLSWLERTTDNREVGGSSPLGPTTFFLWRKKEGKGSFSRAWHTGRGGIAQLVEHLLCKQGVTGSSPITSTI